MQLAAEYMYKTAAARMQYSYSQDNRQEIKRALPGVVHVEAVTRVEAGHACRDQDVAPHPLHTLHGVDARPRLDSA